VRRSTSSSGIIMDFDFRLTRDLPAEKVLDLLRQANWWGEEDTPEEVLPMLKGSFRVAGAFDPENHLVGMARALSDGVSDAYIQDVVVDRAFRRRGIGAELVRMLTEDLQKCGISWIGLVGVPGTEPFYRKLGFEPLAEHVPMLLGRKDQ